MEVDFTEVRGLFLSSILATFLLNCQPKEEIRVNASQVKAAWVAGRMTVSTKVFSGELFQIFPQSIDTASIEHYVNGLEDGIWRKYYPSGQLYEIRAYDHGKKTGTYEAYWENGKRMRVFEFENDEYQGLCREWNEGGQLIKEMHYEKGHEQGAQKMFYDNGKIRSNYLVLEGRRYGLLGTKNCRNISEKVFSN
ncbi:toxin-antitoxin system YwqK family antitoxin [Aquirufa aurantiipilula]|uniref:Toxin-antitoxin system YwqK family antitoxin n=1 Tax=Aquirufa aurantiipilula TaxID=2696561 RepID=A0ABT6BH09_9BACT|nr:toxin-antitoxin system YwqK family antitoxin [Aquirufa aurantiipilula]MBZ1326360.1 toxin-antitoxin system YwqK family antitoxin [Aquirufa aurantiipilula]MDF5689460.1 toxin-antitoxin system YwqK family antitoxin [Aquirufa aurantiipilula]